MGVFNTHRILKLIKLFLVSPELQNILIGFLILIYPIHVFVNEFNSFDEIRISDLKKIYKFGDFYPITKKLEFYNYLETILLPQIYLDYPTPFILFTSPQILQKVSDQSQSELTLSIPCIQDSTAAILTKCDFTTMTIAEKQLIDEVYSRSSLSEQGDCYTEGYLDTYSICEYFSTLGRKNYTEIIDTMRQHEWIHTDTLFVVLQFSMYNVISQSYFFIKYILEFDQNSAEILSNQIQHSIVQPSDKIFGICILIFLFILNVLYTFKMLLEFNLVINKWTFVSHLINIMASWAYVGFTLAIQVLSQQITSFQSLRSLDQMQQMQSLSSLFVFFILPFRIFTWITQFRHFRWVKKFSNVVFKTFPGMFISLIVFLLTFLFVIQMNQAKLYSDLSILQQYTATSFLTSFDFNSAEISAHAFEQKQAIPFLLIFPTFTKAVNSILYIYFLSLFIDLFRRASHYEFRDLTKFQQEFNQHLVDLDNKVESTKSVIKEYISKQQLDKQTDKNQKILLYFHLKSIQETEGERFELLQEDISDKEFETLKNISNVCAENQITIRKFDYLDQMIQFIVCLTNIRSEYFSLNSGEKLRIFFYIENKEFFKESQVNQLNNFLEILQNKGVIYPIIYYSSSFSFSHSIQIALRTIYRQCLCTDSVDILAKFCNMHLSFKDLEHFVYFSDAEKVKRDSLKLKNTNINANMNNNINNNNNNISNYNINTNNNMKMDQLLQKQPSQQNQLHSQQSNPALINQMNQRQQPSTNSQNFTNQMNLVQKQTSQENNVNNHSGSTPANNHNSIQPYNSLNTYKSQNSSESKDQSYIN